MISWYFLDARFNLQPVTTSGPVMPSYSNFVQTLQPGAPAKCRDFRMHTHLSNELAAPPRAQVGCPRSNAEQLCFKAASAWVACPYRCVKQTHIPHSWLLRKRQSLVLFRLGLRASMSLKNKMTVIHSYPGWTVRTIRYNMDLCWFLLRLLRVLWFDEQDLSRTRPHGFIGLNSQSSA